MNRAAESSVNYDSGWQIWNDMIRYSPAPFHRRRLVLRALRGLRFSSLLDVGCGNGETLMAVAREHEATFMGVDLSPLVIAENTRKLPRLRFATLNVEDSALDEVFDVVLCSEVLEHCLNLEQAIRNLRKMTRRYLILTVPGGPRFPIDRAMGHHRHFAARPLAEALERHDFAVDTMLHWGFPFHPLYKLAINCRPEAMIDGFAGGTYGSVQKMVGLVLRGLFYLSVPGLGWQLVVVARAA